MCSLWSFCIMHASTYMRQFCASTSVYISAHVFAPKVSSPSLTQVLAQWRHNDHSSSHHIEVRPNSTILLSKHCHFSDVFRHTRARSWLPCPGHYFEHFFLRTFFEGIRSHSFAFYRGGMLLQLGDLPGNAVRWSGGYGLR